MRARIAKTPENSEFTSIKERITPQFNLNEAIQAQTADGQLFEFKLDLKPLLPFCNSNGGESHNGIPFAFDQCLDLVDFTGRILRDGKKGTIPRSSRNIFERLKIDNDAWLRNTTSFEHIFQAEFAKRRRPRSKLIAGNKEQTCKRFRDFLGDACPIISRLLSPCLNH